MCAIWGPPTPPPRTAAAASPSDQPLREKDVPLAREIRLSAHFGARSAGIIFELIRRTWDRFAGPLTSCTTDRLRDVVLIVILQAAQRIFPHPHSGRRSICSALTRRWPVLGIGRLPERRLYKCRRVSQRALIARSRVISRTAAV